MLSDQTELKTFEAALPTNHLYPMDLYSVVHDVINGFGDDCQGRRLQIDADDHIFVMANRRDVLHILRILTHNALHRSAAHSPVTIRVTRARHEAVVSVEDRGTGIQPEELGSIFRTGQSLGTRHNLALSTARRVLEGQGGRIWAESTGIPGQGASFCIRLPLAPTGTAP